jgi:hypothetical protein
MRPVCCHQRRASEKEEEHGAGEERHRIEFTTIRG